MVIAVVLRRLWPARRIEVSSVPCNQRGLWIPAGSGTAWRLYRIAQNSQIMKILAPRDFGF
jgi:hypothetical protein